MSSELVKVLLIGLANLLCFGVFDLLLIAVHLVDLLRSGRLFGFLVLTHSQKPWEPQ